MMRRKYYINITFHFLYFHLTIIHCTCIIVLIICQDSYKYLHVHHHHHHEQSDVTCCALTELSGDVSRGSRIGETGASCYRGRLLQGRFMQNYHIDGEIADSSCIRIHQGNHWRKKTIDARELFEIWTQITVYYAETCLRIFTTFLLVTSITKNDL